MKKQTDKARQIYMAQTYAEFAQQAKIAGEAGRAVVLYEVALHNAINALDGYLKQEPFAVDKIRQLYVSAALYAQESGRYRKAEHLREQATLFDERQ